MQTRTPKFAIKLPNEAIAAFCRRHHILRLEVFGSILGTDFKATSDIDFLVTYGPESAQNLGAIFEREQELATILGRKVDFISRRAIEQHENSVRRAAILESAEEIYAA